MEQKKTPRADLEKEKPVFLLMGFIVVLSILFVVFEWRNEKTEYPDNAAFTNLFIEEPFEVVVELPQEELSSEKQVISEDIPKVIVSEGYTPVDHPNIQPELPESSETISGKPEVPVDTIPHKALHKTEDVVLETDTMPEFSGGRAAFIRYLYQSIKYPEAASKQRIQGRVVCSFIVETDGSISNIELVQSIYIFLDDEALRVIRAMPQWRPGVKNGKGVRVKCYVPVVFRL